jgi:cytochrome P450
LSSLEALPYLTAVIDEVLRLYPAIPGPYPRDVPAGGLNICGHHLPEGTVVESNAYVVHRASYQHNIWGEDLEEFRPERWLVPSADATAMHAASITFGTGPRSCIGRRVAMMQLYAVLAAFVARFDGDVVTKGDGMLPAGAFNIGPAGGKCVLRLKIRE